MSPVRESIARDLLRLLIWYPIRWLVLCLPAKAGIAVLCFMGDIHFLLGGRKKKKILENLERLKEIEFVKVPNGYVRQYFRNYYVDRLFIWIFPKFTAQNLGNFMDISGLEHLNKAMEDKKGTILLHGHFGPVHLPLVALALLGYPMKQIGYLSDKGLSCIGRTVAFRLRTKYECRIPAQIVQAGSYMRPVIRWLNMNGVLMTTGDGTGTKQHIGRQLKLTFKGHPVCFPLGPYLLAKKTGAVILPMFIVPGQSKLFRIIIEPPLAFGSQGESSVEKMASLFARRFSMYITEYPGYMHFLDRFHPGGLIETDEKKNQ